ncbi:MAG: hypothetical protein H8E55_62755 [Pelagibacterales bacterium]|nr:hypothetical protein [Pelagibacterales bacterium]
MGFDDVLNMFLPKKTLSEKEIRQYLQRPQTIDSRSHLTQGMRLANIREGFDDNNNKFVKMGRKEKKVLRDISNNYDRAVSQYATAYKQYLEEHATLTKSVEDCRVDCLERITGDGIDVANQKKACVAGCSLKGVQVLKCKNTYKGHNRDASKKCKDLVANHCTDGSVNPGTTSQNFVNSSEQADSHSTTLAEGCCECGGGGGGKPSAYINGTQVKSCNDLDKAFGGNSGDGTAANFKPFCQNAGSGVSTFNASKNANFHQKYSAVKSKNDAAMTEANKLKKKINTLIQTRNKLRGTIASEEDSLDANLKIFEEKYSELTGYGEGGKDYTSIALHETTMNKKNAEELKFYMWSVLAIVLIITVVSNFKKKPA